MTTNAPELLDTTSGSGTSPSRIRKAVTNVRDSRPAQAVATHRKPVTAGLLALAGAATAALFALRKRRAKTSRSAWRPAFRRH
ncbi:hypothetical protein BJY16_004037 [Actinoplanes octamycinicus]|uniref:Uncharacterized protein n=1 Tax=Actinoplanes octamycinicus TaxID=135948 RepID=A0A7W7GYF6_9ACTN|nr:hypothetical protein [Actinoplanes octamycinicus]GIE63121.1 hypothetical protein Aoc01nite_85230 [Actinoplanes octamycinicus]